jgi:hypothetical protein
MKDRPNDDPIHPSQEELEALLSSPSIFSSQGVGASLVRRSTLFKRIWFVLMSVPFST